MGYIFRPSNQCSSSPTPSLLLKTRETQIIENKNNWWSGVRTPTGMKSACRATAPPGLHHLPTSPTREVEGKLWLSTVHRAELNCMRQKYVV